MIGYYVHHHGRGHLNRALSLARCLGEPVTGLSSLSRPAEWVGPWVDLVRDDVPAVPPSTDVDAHGRLHWVPLRHSGLRRRQAQISAWIADTDPAALVVDVSVEVAVLARLHGVRVVVIAQPGTRTDEAHRLGYDVADLIVAPWPEGSFALAGGSRRPRWADRLVCVGAFSRVDDIASAGDRPTDRAPAPEPVDVGSSGPRQVLVLWGSGGDRVDPARIAAAEAATPGTSWTLAGSGETPAARIYALLQGADVVVTHGGLNALAEVAAAARPCVVIPQPRPFEEQHVTAAELSHRGLAVTLPDWPPAHAWPRILRDAAALGGTGWTAWNDGHGAERAAHHIHEAAHAR